MFRNTFQSGFLSILYSIGSKPLQIWDKKGKCPTLHDTSPPACAPPRSAEAPRRPCCMAPRVCRAQGGRVCFVLNMR